MTFVVLYFLLSPVPGSLLSVLLATVCKGGCCVLFGLKDHAQESKILYM